MGSTFRAASIFSTRTMEQRVKVGLALGGGSARGFAHIGILRVLQAEGISIDCVAGTSIGAIVGSMYAAERLPKVEEFLQDFDWKDMTLLLDPLLPVSGLLGGKRIEKLFRSFLGELVIEDFPKPFAAVAVDVATGGEVVLTTGDAVKAVRASMSIPGVFTPVPLNDRLLVDGGMVNPIPVNAVRNLGADVVIAVNLTAEMSKRSYIDIEKGPAELPQPAVAITPVDSDIVQTSEKGDTADTYIPPILRETLEKGRSFVEEQTRAFDRWFDETVEKGREVLHEQESFLSEWFSRRKKSNLPDIFSVLFNSINIMQEQIAEANLLRYPPDVLLEPDLAQVRLVDFNEIEYCIQEGERVARKALSDIRQAIERQGEGSPR